jgi:hypothetical protein
VEPYELFSGKKDAALIQQIKDEFLTAKEDQPDSSQDATKSDEQIARMFYKQVYDFSSLNLSQTYQETLQTMVNKQAGLLLLHILKQ